MTREWAGTPRVGQADTVKITVPFIKEENSRWIRALALVIGCMAWISKKLFEPLGFEEDLEEG